MLNDFDNLDSIWNLVAVAVQFGHLKLSSCLDCYEISVYLLKWSTVTVCSWESQAQKCCRVLRDAVYAI